MGKTLGGSSAINLGMVVYPSKANFESWEALGNPGWGWEGISPYLRKFHTHTPPSESVQKLLQYECNADLQGKDGPIQVSFGQDYMPFHEAWVSTFKTQGYSLTADPLSGESSGPFTCGGSVDPISKTRSFAATGYYSPDVAARPNLRVVTEAYVEKVLLKKEDGLTTATGVQVITKDGVRREIASKKEIILAAGSFKTPQILELSGIGNGHLLKAAGIEVTVDNSNVGENLQDHGLVPFSWEVADGQVSGDIAKNPEVAAAAMKAYQEAKAGPLGQVLFVSSFLPLDGLSTDQRLKLVYSSFGKSEETPGTEGQYEQLRGMLRKQDEPTAQYSFAPIQLLARSGPLPGGIFGMGKDGLFVSVIAVLNHPFSRGSTHIHSSVPTDNPVIDTGFLSHDLDLELQARHLLFLEKLMASEPMASLLKPGGRRLHQPDDGPQPVQDLDEAKRIAKELIISHYHPCGTCAMMPRHKGGVVDDHLLVYGTKNLRIVDASIFPLIPRGNIQSTVYAVAEKAADIIRASGA